MFVGRANKQFKWPWNVTLTVGTVHIVTNVSTAIAATEKIIDQRQFLVQYMHT